MLWIDNVFFIVFLVLKVVFVGDGYICFNWKVVMDNDKQNVFMYVVYVLDMYLVDIMNLENIFVQNLWDMYYIYVFIFLWIVRKYFVVMVVDCCGNESKVV